MFKVESSSPKDVLLLSLIEIGQVVLEKKVFKFRQWVFAISLLSPFGEGCGPSNLMKLNSLHPRMLCAKFDRNWLRASREEDF